MWSWIVGLVKGALSLSEGDGQAELRKLIAEAVGAVASGDVRTIGDVTAELSALLHTLTGDAKAAALRELGELLSAHVQLTAAQAAGAVAVNPAAVAALAAFPPGGAKSEAEQQAQLRQLNPHLYLK